MNSYDNTKAGTPTPARVTQISEQVVELNKNIEGLAELVTTLVDRLAPILSPDNPQKTEQDAPEPGLAPLAETLRTFNKKILIIYHLLEETRQRTEL